MSTVKLLIPGTLEGVYHCYALAKKINLVQLLIVSFTLAAMNGCSAVLTKGSFATALSVSLLSRTSTDNSNHLLSGLLTTERLKSFSDSVLLVAITILAYNLVPPSIVNGQVNPNELENFFYNLYGLISSFMVISVFWLFSLYFFEYLKQPTEIITLALMAFFILILITPISTVAELQYRNWEAVLGVSLLQVINSAILMILWWNLGKSKNLQSKELENNIKKKMYIRLAIIPSLYVISIGLSFYNFDVAVVFPVFMIPSLILVAKVHKDKHGDKK